MPRVKGKKGKKKMKKRVDKYASLSPEERDSRAQKQKDIGNAAFSANKFEEALVAFTDAVELDPLAYTVFANRSVTYLKLQQAAVQQANAASALMGGADAATAKGIRGIANTGDYLRKAINDAKKCIHIKADWPKGYLRLGQAYMQGQQYENAHDAYEKGYEMEPMNSQMEAGLRSAKRALGRSTKELDEESERRAALAAQKAQMEAGLKLGPDGKPITTSDVIGIDLGTTYSCVGVWREGKVEIVPNEEGARTTASCVSFMEGNERLIGNAAKVQGASNPVNTVYDVKRIIGQRFADEEVQKDIARFPYKVISDATSGKPLVEITSDGKTQTFPPEAISAMVLGKMKKIAESFLNKEISKAVVTVPAYFSDAQRQATKDAGAIAGLDVLRIINEPTAAALAYGLDTSEQKESEPAKEKSKLAEEGEKKVLVFDLGGGTFDVSLLSIDGGIFKVLATAGDTHLGGEDFDNLLSDYVVKEFLKKNKKKCPEFDPKTNMRAMKRIKAACERAKRNLSSSTTASIELEAIVDDIDFSMNISRAKFNALGKEHFEKTIDVVKRVMTDAQCPKEGVHEIVLVGGSTRIPKIQDMLVDYFEGKQLCKTINPDEAVAYGAAVQGAILGGVRNNRCSDLLLVDVTPLSLGIETTGRMMSTIIKRNTPIPCSKTKTYTTEVDWQTEIDIEIFEGERASTEGNNLLGKFTVSGIEKAKRGVPEVDVTFELDSDGILKVSARDQKTGASGQVTIAKNAGRLSEEEIKRMVEEAEKFKEQDGNLQKRMEAKNDLDRTLYECMDQLTHQANSNVSRRMRAKLEAAQYQLQDIKRWVDSHPEAGSEDLSRRQKQAEDAYKAVFD